MQDEFSRLHSQDAAIGLVREFMAREDIGKEGVRNRRTPVLVFTGPRGIGKTALLTRLRAELEGVPHAYIDCAGPVENAQDILLLLAFFLNRQSGGYGKLPFPKLITGEIVIGAKIELDTTDWSAACRQVGNVLAEHRKTAGALEDTVGAMANVAVKLLASRAGWVDADPAAGELAGKYGAKLVRRVLGSSRFGRRMLLGDGQDWYRDQDINGDSLGALVGLKMAADRAAARRTEGDDDRREVARILWAAFLADLRDSFRDGGGASDQTLNCVVMLDNADTAVGRSFLEELLDARRQREQEPDPLTVVATSRDGLTEKVRATGVTALADAGYQHYARRGEHDLARWWYLVGLPPLSWTQTREMVAAMRPPGFEEHVVATAVHAFTGGHPRATATLLAAMGENPKAENPKAGAHLLVCLDEPEPRTLADGGRTVEEAMLADLRGHMSAAEAEDLVTWAAARHKEDALQLAVRSDLLEQRLGPATFAPEYWYDDPAGGPARMQPLLRRLLLRRLARREPTARATWTTVHEWLSDHAGEVEAELYHTLALADEDHPEHVEYVVARLLAGNIEASGEWLRSIARVTAAPNRLNHHRTPIDHRARLTAWAERREPPVAAVGRLVVCSWLGADPLCAPHWRWLLHEMANELDLIAPECASGGLAGLREAARRYRDTARGSWSEVEDFWVARTTPSTETITGAIR